MTRIPPAVSRCTATVPHHRRITINGRFLAQKTSGVQRYARQILAAMADLLAESPGPYAGLNFQIALPSDAAGLVPEELDFATRVVGTRRGYAWEQLELPLAAGLSLNLCNLAPFASRRKVVCIHDVNTYLAPYSYDWKYRAFQRVSMPLLGRTASAVVTVSHSSARALAAVGVVRDAGAVIVAPNGHEHALAWRPDKATIDLRAVGHRPFVVMLGGRAPHKNVALLRQIAPELAARGIDCVVTGSLDGVFAGESPGDLGPIHAVGHVSDDDIALLFSRAVCLLFPSFVEGFGLPIVEAMARGCPVVASDRSCMPEICADAAILVSPEEPAGWIAAILGLSENPGLRADRIAAGHARVGAYSWRTSAQTYLDLLGRLADAPP